MISLENETLTLRFPEVHPGATSEVSFQRTLRIPDDNREYPLPPGLGRFPLRHVDDYADSLPAAWRTHGGVLLPMHQSEAMWISFRADYPMALKVAAGKINAVTGEPWARDLSADPQDYLVLPDQPWLDGFCVAKGTIRQFVAMPLGKGFTAEEQITGQAEHGGLQIIAFPMKANVYKELFERRLVSDLCPPPPTGDRRLESIPLEAMGLAPGGLMRQEIYEDDHGIDAWDTSTSARCFVHLLNSRQFLSVTGTPAPTMPPTAKDYSDAGLPWFEHYGGDKAALDGAEKLAGLHSVAAKSWQQGTPLTGNQPAQPHIIRTVGERRLVREDEAP